MCFRKFCAHIAMIDSGIWWTADTKSWLLQSVCTFYRWPIWFAGTLYISNIWYWPGAQNWKMKGKQERKNKVTTGVPNSGETFSRRINQFSRLWAPMSLCVLGNFQIFHFLCRGASTYTVYIGRRWPGYCRTLLFQLTDGWQPLWQIDFIYSGRIFINVSHPRPCPY